MRISDWSSDVCSSDLQIVRAVLGVVEQADGPRLVRDLLERKRDPHTVARRRAPVIVKHERHAASPSPSASRSALRSSARSEEHTSELQSLMRNSYAVFCLKKKKANTEDKQNTKRSAIHTK